MNLLKEIKNYREKVYSWEKELHHIDLNHLLQFTLNWFKVYQWDEDLQKMRDLYKKLVKEELSEISQAWYNKDIIELLDWYVDYLWVTIWYIYFDLLYSYKDVVDWEDALVEEMTERINELLKTIIIPKDLFSLAWLEVAYSNWTKSLEKRDESDPEWKAWKIIKWPSFVKPDLKKVFNFLRNKNVI